MIHKQIIADIIAEIEAAKNYQAGICHENVSQITTIEQIQFADAKAAKGAYEHALRIIKQRLNWTECGEKDMPNKKRLKKSKPAFWKNPKPGDIVKFPHATLEVLHRTRNGNVTYKSQDGKCWGIHIEEWAAFCERHNAQLVNA